MSQFFLSAFADEAAKNLPDQILALKNHNVNHLEIRGVNGKNISELSIDEAKKIADILTDNNIRVSAIGSFIGKIMITDDFITHLEDFKKIIHMAAIFNSPYIRIFSFFIPKSQNADDFRDEVLSRLQRFVELIKGHNVTLLHENEKDIYGDNVKRCLDIFKSLNNSQLKMTFDPANFIQCGEEVYPYAYENLKEYIAYVHIKDAIFKTKEVVPAGYGDSRLLELITRLKDSNYQGFLSLEPHLTDFTGFAQLEGDSKILLPKGDNMEKFSLAINSLKKILDLTHCDYR